jgi:hypothetical protein
MDGDVKAKDKSAIGIMALPAAILQAGLSAAATRRLENKR